ncbi:MAG: Pteridine reductase [Hydrocarboniphaga sp.]|uniref:SDR family oxidoreductase n=1 Tax=Hydrocarboniphaga sp. TaxID=2033016 RepID=UPI00261BA3C0|nr:SDR family oxidoreductase [Hydrocarboniphaga sp.]MDB5968252.1 Pteridine reductase [Hydrocarboniphaga sp.]
MKVLATSIPEPQDGARVALITGAGRRIGLAIARDLHAAGWNLLLHYRSGDETPALEAELNASRATSAASFRGDLGDAALPAAISAAAIERYGRLDALINNASSFYPTPLDTLSHAQFDELMASNLKGPLFLAQACARRMSDGAAIVNLLDIHARKPMPGYVAYCAAKAALWSVTESLAVELAPKIRVNGIAPGRMIWGGGDNLDDAQRRAELARIPMGRLGGGDEVARAVRFLLSADAAYLNGAILPVDGGLRLA